MPTHLIELSNQKYAAKYVCYEQLVADVGHNMTWLMGGILSLINTWAYEEGFVKLKTESEISSSLLANTFVVTLLLSDKGKPEKVISYAQAVAMSKIFYLCSNVTDKEYLREGFGTQNIYARLEQWSNTYSYLQPVTQVAADNLKIINLLLKLGAQPIEKPTELPLDTSREKLFFDLTTVNFMLH